jgi:proteasome lid subunit RPN8/RPN11
LLFFREVYRKHRAEAIVILAYNQTEGCYTLCCPTQDVSQGHVTYDRDWQNYAEDGYKPVGTIHSHCNFQAFHSGVDTGDEADYDGVHITLGHVAEEAFSWASSLVLNDHRESVEADNVATELLRVGDRSVRQSRFIAVGAQNYYEVNLTKEELQQLRTESKVELEAWMANVKEPKRNFLGGGGSGGYSGYTGYSSYNTVSGYDEYEEDELGGGVSYVLVNGKWVPYNGFEDADDADDADDATDSDSSEDESEEDLWAEREDGFVD